MPAVKSTSNPIVKTSMTGLLPGSSSGALRRVGADGLATALAGLGLGFSATLTDGLAAPATTATFDAVGIVTGLAAANACVHIRHVTGVPAAISTPNVNVEPQCGHFT